MQSAQPSTYEVPSIDDESDRAPIVRETTEWLRLGLLLVLVILFYVPAVSAPFIWQDAETVTNNPAVRSRSVFWWSTTHPAAVPGVYRPLATAFLLLQYRLWGDWNPSGYHTVSLLIHLLNTTLVWLLFRRLRLPLPLLAASVFALHPVAVQSVAWVTQQPNLFGWFFALSFVLISLRALDPPFVHPELETWRSRPAPLFCMAAILFAAALLCDPITWVAAPVVMMLAWWRIQTDEKRPRALLILLSIFGFAYHGLTLWLSSRHASDSWSWSPLSHLLIAGSAAWFGLLKFVIPFPLLFLYAKPASFTAWWAWICVVATAIAFFVAWRNQVRWGKGPLVAIGIWLLLIFVGLPLFRLKQSPAIFADTQQYAARIAFIAAAVSLVASLRFFRDRSSVGRATRIASVAVLFGLMALLTWRQASLYANPYTLWTKTLAHNDSAQPHIELGRLLMEGHSFGQARAHFESAAKLSPDDPTAIHLLTAAMEAQGDSAAVIDRLKTLSALQPNDAELHRRLAAAHGARGDIAGAEKEYREAIRWDPKDDRAYNNLATLYARSGKTNDAIELYKTALSVNPRGVTTHLNLANLYFSVHRLDEAASHLQRAVEIDPKNYDAYMTAGGMLMQFKEFYKASRMFLQAVQIRRDSPQAYNSLGVSLAAQGQFPEAIWNFDKALDFNPKYDAARRNRDAAVKQRDEREKAGLLHKR